VSTQITVRLPNDLVEFLDSRVAAGDATSRASVVAQAIARERRHRVALEDARIYAATGEDADLAAFTRGAAASIEPLD
jgi:Arc/MetJ-type ribon-helix-helix transcriptional regulator